MKKYIYMAVAGMLALSSCSNDDNEPVAQNAPRQMTFSAGFGGGAQTRATLDIYTRKVSFDAGDEISILSANNANAKFTTTAGGASATFRGTAVDDSKFYAVYPYTSGLALSGTTITGIVIPTTQWNNQWNYQGGLGSSSWDPKAPIAYATTEGSSLQFHNLCAILNIYVDGGWNGTITISSADYPLAGTFSLDTSTGTLTATEGSNTVTIGNDYNGLENLISANCKALYIAIAPGTYADFTVHAEDSGNHKTDERTASDVTFEAGKIYVLGTFDAFD